MNRVQSRGPQSGWYYPPVEDPGGRDRYGAVFVGHRPHKGKRVQCRAIAYDVERRTFTYLVKPLRQPLRA